MPRWIVVATLSIYIFAVACVSFLYVFHDILQVSRSTSQDWLIAIAGGLAPFVWFLGIMPFVATLIYPRYKSSRSGNVPIIVRLLRIR